MDPISSVQWLDAGSKVLGAALGGNKSGGPAGPSNATSMLDASGWMVATGGSKLDGQTIPWGWLIAGSVAAILIWKKA